jgi:hypothetical protein
MVINGTVLIVEPDPTVASIWAEVAAFAGFVSEVVPRVPDLRSKPEACAVVVRLSPDCRTVAVDRRATHRPRLIALPAAGSSEPDLTDFDVVLPCDGQVHALYAELRRLASRGDASMPT